MIKYWSTEVCLVTCQQICHISTHFFGDNNNASEFESFFWLLSKNTLKGMNSSIVPICNDTNDLKVWSTYCLNIAFLEPCYYPSKHYGFNFVTGIWCVISGLIGFVGNLLTIFAIPYAAKKKM